MLRPEGSGAITQPGVEEEAEEGPGEEATCEAVFFAEKQLVVDRLKLIASPATDFNEAVGEEALQVITR